MKAFTTKDANEWFERNKNALGSGPDPVCDLIEACKIVPTSILEVGAANGWRLKRLKEEYGCPVSGVDLSSTHSKYVELCSADQLVDQFPIDCCDLLIYGFVLYLCNPDTLSAVVFNGDCVLEDGGHLVIHDFAPDYPHSRVYKHNPEILVHKMDHANLWLALPQYTLVDRVIFAHKNDEEINNDTRVAVTILKKDVTRGWPREP